MAFLKTFGEDDRPKSRIILGSVGPARDRQGIRTYKSYFKFYYDVAHLFYPALWAKGPQVVAGKKVGWAFGPPPPFRTPRKYSRIIDYKSAHI